MNTYKVYKHSTLGVKTVKVGFSWVGLFFPIFWLIYHQLWKQLMMVFGIFGVIYMAVSLAGSEHLGDDLANIYATILIFYYGFKGNDILANRFEEKGYEMVKVVQDASHAGARAQVS